MKKIIVYALIFVIWIIACMVLYTYNLIDRIGIVVSFVFAIPPVAVDVISSKMEDRRKHQLKQIGVLYQFLQYLEKKILENKSLNIRRERAGIGEKPIDLESAIHKEFADSGTQTRYKNSLRIVFGKKKCDVLYLKMEKDRQEFRKILEQKVLELKPTEEECQFYKIVLSDDLKIKLFSKQHKDIKE